MNNIESIMCNGCMPGPNNEIYTYYVINEGKPTEFVVRHKYTSKQIVDLSSRIINKNKEFKNGFKVVRLSDNRYGYIKEETGELLPYRYDYAGDFNKYGYAMVAKSGFVTWINKEFKYLTISGDMKQDEAKICAFRRIDEFSEGEIPLSRLYQDLDPSKKHISYLGIDGKIKSFYQYDGKRFKPATTEFKTGSIFNKQGYAIDEEKIMFAKGYYCTAQDLLECCKEGELVEAIEDSIDVKSKRLRIEQQ